MWNRLRLFFLDDLREYRVARSFAVRGMGAIYLIAILSWWVQVPLLVGSNGLVPAQELLDIVGPRLDNSDQSRFASLPTLFWFTGASDLALHVACGIGCLLAIAVILGLWPGFGLLGLWLIYLSLQTTGDVFMGFQWDILLLEAGFLSLFLAPWIQRLQWKIPNPLTLSQRVALLLFWVLIAKLMFQSGWVKLGWATDQYPEWWPDHTAMTFHYFTQPIPTWTAWWAHQLPDWFQKFSIWPMYFVELALPFFVFFGKPGRLIAAVGFIALMVLILLTGNYTYFNWLTIVISLPLIADRYWPRKRLRLLRVEIESVQAKPLSRRERIQAAVLAPVFLLLFALNYQVLARDFHRAPIPLLKADLSPRWLDALAGKTQPFMITSGYGLFRTMTTTRPEIILEGSLDGKEWQAYDFHWKPDELNEKPRFVAPHQPRVAWQLWFAALEGQYDPQSRNARWLQSLLPKLLNHDSSVNSLFRNQPFADQPPKYLRARLFHYEFTNRRERKASGNWWRRKVIGDYLPIVNISRQ